MYSDDHVAALDLVCRMIISEKEAEYSSTYNGVTYYFCAAPCKREFDEHTEDYV